VGLLLGINVANVAIVSGPTVAPFVGGIDGAGDLTVELSIDVGGVVGNVGSISCVSYGNDVFVVKVVCLACCVSNPTTLLLLF